MNTSVVKQDQRSVTDQLQTLIDLANKHGLYDAADWVRDRLEEQKARRLSRRPTMVPK